MKKTLLTVVLFIAVVAIFAQNPVAKSQAQINAGVGLSSWGIPVYLGLDYGIHKDVTMGAELSYRSYRDDDWDDKDSHHYDHSVTGISGNVNYHFSHILNIPRNWDFYAGLNVGYYIWNSSKYYHGDHSSGLGLGAQIGGRYYFNNSIGVNLELGGGNAFNGGKLGLSFKL
ncbi:MAG: porin family protein [Candidatus Cloacimonetes bacterium]|jgi:hypothetical protein|nr:porin family protein [Candidatus Cloacimonadota bacterium]MCB5288123.1 porin family protein [Candidatus Cloacimonadota bacterium]MCK9185125.1 porin family protein [Candidatus Cloacimonadota bacterium]MDY0230447.1 hypothetical protein [Candidatus Cloacimonadaceae bacterium]